MLFATPSPHPPKHPYVGESDYRRWAIILIIDQFFKTLAYVVGGKIAVFRMKWGNIISRECSTIAGWLCGPILSNMQF